MKFHELYKDDEEITLSSYLIKNGVKDVEEFLNPVGKYLDNYLDYYNINDAIKMFKKNIGKDAYILCDSGDTDGITSTVIMYQYMKNINTNWNIEILIHEGKERGLQDEILFNHIKENPRPFLIIPDSGSNDLEQSIELSNIDILVLDHHTIMTPIQNGVLINNQDERNNVSRYGSGCLVTHKFLWALDKTFNFEFTSAQYIDLVALSLVSDIMNMADEQNRTYYHYGLETFDCIQNEFLKALFTRFIGDGKTYTQTDISFKIVPKLNSICRSKNQEYKYILINAFLGIYNNDIDEILDLCATAHKNQQALVEEIIDNNINEITKVSKNKLVIFACDDMPKSYSGLVAGKIMDVSGGKPAIVGKIIENNFIGSLRSPIPLQGELDNNDLVEWARGHEQSCGVSIPKDNIDELVKYYNNFLTSYEPHIDVLKSYNIDSIPYNLFKLFDPHTNVLWGNGLPQPLFGITNIKYYPIDIKILGSNKRTLKLTINGISILIFNVTKKDKERLGLGYIDEENNFVDNINEKQKILNIVGTIGVNVYVGRYGKTYINNQIIVDKFEVKEYNVITKENLFK